MLFVVLGLVVGSFLNVLIWRLNDSKAPKFWQGRSLCPKCKKPIAWLDNIPLLSFLLLGGRCRHCGKKISWQYPLVELIAALAFWLVGWQAPLLVLVSAFIVVFFSDWIYGLIPDEMVVLGVIASFFSGWRDWGTGFLAAAMLFLIVLVTRFLGMGLGDVKLAFLMGFFLGWPKVGVAFWLAFVMGGLAAGILLLLKRKRFSDRIAFGPYLVLGTIISALWSNNLLALVLR